MRGLRALLLGSAALLFAAGAARADGAIVASIKPVHSLVAAVMQGVGTPALIVEGASSPHTYSLKPSQAHDLEHARAVFWIGPEMEAFLARPIETLARGAKTVALIEADGLTRLAFREGGPFEDHGHDGHGDDHGHAEAGHDSHDHEKAAEADHGHEHEHAEAKHDDDHGHDHDHEQTAEAGHDHDDHGHGAFDGHVWLDPHNARAMVQEIGEALADADPANAQRYKANADAVARRLDDLTAEIAATLEPVRDRPFVVFHDAYQYFERRFGLSAAGSITVIPDVMPGAERVAEVREKVGELGATCVFSEPQFEPKLVQVVTEGTGARTAVLDPLGASIDAGPDQYFALMRAMAKSVRDCLWPSS